MNGQPTGLEPANAGSAVDAANADASAKSERFRLWHAAEASLEAEHEYKAAREVGDALQRLQAREGQRRSEGLHGENPQETAEVS